MFVYVGLPAGFGALRGHRAGYTRRMRAVLWVAGPALALWALAGLVVRHKVSHAYCLPPFLAALIASAVLPAIAPTSYDWRLWLLKETVHTVLAFALGLELAWRLFRNLPGAALVARVIVLAVLAGTAAIVATAPPGQVPIADLSVVVLPRMIVGLAWLYFGIAMATAFFLMPEDALHEALLVTLPGYFMLYAVVSAGLTRDLVRGVADYGLPLLWLVVLVVIGRAAWAHHDVPDAPPPLLRLLWPWR